MSAAAPACDPNNGGITLPAGFCAFLAADGLGEARHIAVAPNGDVYVGLMNGGVAALRDTNGDGRFEMKEKFGATSVTGIELHNGYLYIATPNTVQRYKMTPGQLKPAGEPEIVVKDLPGVQQHGDKGIAFDGKGSLYVNIGAPSNACQTRDRRAGVAGPGSLPAPERARRHLEVRREQAGPDPRGRVALCDRNAPDAGHRLARRTRSTSR